MNLATIVSFVLMAVVILLPGLRTVFNVVPFNWQDWDFVIRVAFLPVVFGELARFRTGRTKEAVEDLFYQFVRRLEELGETEHNEVFIGNPKELRIQID